MSEKIIIIGGSGAIGKAFVEFYKEQNSSNIVYSFSRSSNPVDNENIINSYIDIQDEVSIAEAALDPPSPENTKDPNESELTVTE